jgi:hypothetical protein
VPALFVAALLTTAFAGAPTTPETAPTSAPPGPLWRGASGAAAGTWLGWELGRLAAPTPSGQTLPILGASIGGAGGLTTGLLLHPANGDTANLALIDLGLGAGWIAGSATADLLGLDAASDRQARAGLELGLGTAVVLGDLWAVRAGRLHPSAPRQATWTALGGWTGFWLPALAEDDNPDGHQEAWAQLGAATGLVASGLSQRPPGTPAEATASLSWAIAGTTLLGGTGALAPVDAAPRLLAAGTIGGALGGASLGQWLLPRYRRGPRPVLGTPLMLAGGQLLAIGGAGMWGIWAEETFPDIEGAATGASLVAYGSAASLSLALPAIGGPTAGGSAAAGSAAIWGHWLGGAGGLALRMRRGPHAATTAIAGEVGMIVAGTASVTGWQPSLTDVALVDGTGLLGAGVGTLVAAAITSDPALRAAGALAGSVAGFGAGWAMTGRKDAPPATAIGGWSRPADRRWRSTVSPAPWWSPNGSPGLALTLTVNEVRP